MDMDTYFIGRPAYGDLLGAHLFRDLGLTPELEISNGGVGVYVTWNGGLKGAYLGRRGPNGITVDPNPLLGIDAQQARILVAIAARWAIAA